uniref:Uncharacterized protein n=1 Tax=Rhizophora mucronata TaxID=61149 RepID=A0A2P2NC28_RHIMU
MAHICICKTLTAEPEAKN